ncbi:ABC transporter ATP-binding protein [Oryzibacter oryziterrae]|uniref:ABC transporter ATP-binding protein n=1 Tax=Oryzibacter oryziterrae TaxID=2766474 RepID=UPI001F00C6FB|nr:ABC transporter ATP-binding protein [Oryzibacter oryziterrae]
MDLVAVEDLTLRWGAVEVLRGVRLTLAPGERVAIIGSNGSGKSSLGQVIAGWHGQGAHRSGTVTIGGDDPAVLSPSVRPGTVQYVGQVPMHQLSGRAFSVKEEIAFGPENLLLPRAEMTERVADLTDRLGLSALADRDPFTLSGGEQQRLSIAAALALRPQVLVLDEPAGNLDVAARGLLARAIEALPRDTAVLLLDVEPDLALRLGCRMLSLSGGVLQPFEPSQPLLPAISGPGDATGDKAILAVQGLSFAYPGSTPLFDGFDARFFPGEAVALTGRNGAGKSTLFRLINGILVPKSGRVILAGNDTRGRRIDQIAVEVGTVFQEPENQLFAPTVRQEVAFGVEQLGLSAQQRNLRVDAVLERVGLVEVAQRHPLDLDAASRRFVAVASALVRAPSLLLLDEAQRGLDRANKARLATLIRQEQGRGAAVIFICHDPDFTALYATRTLSLS